MMCLTISILLFWYWNNRSLFSDSHKAYK